MKRTSDTTVKVLRYMRNKPGMFMHYTDVAADLDLDAKNVNASLARVVARHPEYGFQRDGSGQYMFRPELQREIEKADEAKPTNTAEEMYEGVGVTKDGTRIVRDTQGVLWKLSERL